MKLTEIAKDSPTFKFEEYFSGYTKASGWFADRFGKVRRHFCGDFHGEFVDNKFVLTEKLLYTDGVIEKRVWTVMPNESGFVATSPSLVGEALARSAGNTLQIDYKMKVDVGDDKTWVLAMNDWMFYQPDGSLHNTTIVSRWGVRIGIVNTQYSRHEGELLCQAAS